jgi:hypothetical protein
VAWPTLKPRPGGGGYILSALRAWAMAFFRTYGPGATTEYRSIVSCGKALMTVIRYGRFAGSTYLQRTGVRACERHRN